MHPGKLTRTPILKVYLRRETGLTAIDRLKQIKRWLAAEKKNIGDEALLKTGKQVEIHGNWANLTLDVLAMQDTVQSVHFEVARKSFSLIVPAKPIQTLESTKKILPAFRPSGAIANNRGSSKRFLLIHKKNSLFYKV